MSAMKVMQESIQPQAAVVRLCYHLSPQQPAALHARLFFSGGGVTP